MSVLSSTATAALLPMSAEYLVHSDVLGTFTISPESTIEFPDGLLGFEHERRFALVRAGSDTAFWLQSLDTSSLLFLLIDPFRHFADYVVDIPAKVVQELSARDAAEMAVLTIVTLPPASDASAHATTNLQGPIAINLRARLAKQIICSDADYGVRCPVTLGVAS